MRITISKQYKLVFLFIITIAIVMNSMLLVNTVLNPGEEEKTTPVYTFTNKAGINYIVSLKPNILYDKNSLEEGSIYISEFIDNIRLMLNYEFTGEREAEIKGSYEVIAAVEGYSNEGKMSDDEKNKTIWKKEFPLIHRTSFEKNDSTILISKDFDITYDNYNSFAKKVIEDSKVSTPVKLVIYANIDLKVSTDKGLINEKLSPSVVLPINTPYFEIAKNEVTGKKGAIEEVTKIQLALNKQMVILYSLLLFILIIALLYLIIFTSGTKVTDIYTKNLNKILRLHGSRMVALNNKIVASYDKYFDLRAMEDLVRVADELEKPIMYEYNSDHKNITKFYVFGDTCIYVFDLKKSMELPSLDELLMKKSNSNDKPPQQSATLAP